MTETNSSFTTRNVPLKILRESASWHCSILVTHRFHFYSSCTEIRGKGEIVPSPVLSLFFPTLGENVTGVQRRMEREKERAKIRPHSHYTAAALPCQKKYEKTFVE